MASETKQTPDTNITRQAGLNAGKAKNDAMGINSFITSGTVTRLNVIQPLYKTKMLAVKSAKAVFLNANNDKDKKSNDCEMVCSHFIQVFYFAVKRGVYNEGDLAYYGVDEDGNLPDMSTDAKRLQVAKDLIDGDAERMLLPGAVPMAMPSIANVLAAKTNFETANTAKNNAEQALKDAQTACNALNREADEVIKLLWGEVETHYTNLPRPTMRAEARLWGVIYNLTGSKKIVTGTVTDKDTGEVIPDANIYFKNGNNDAESTDTGFELSTYLMNVQLLIAEHPLYEMWQEDVTLVENENMVVDIKMIKKP